MALMHFVHPSLHRIFQAVIFRHMFALTMVFVAASLLSNSAWADHCPPCEFMDRSDEARRAGRNQEAINFATDAIEYQWEAGHRGLDGRRLAQAHTGRGVAFNRMGEVDRAIEDYDRAINLFPWGAIAYPNSGAASRKLIAFRHAIASAYINRGIANGRLIEWQRAIEDFDQAIKLNPRAAFAYTNRGRAYRELGEFQRALPDLDQSITLRPENAGAYNERALIYHMLGDNSRGLLDANESIRLRPGRNNHLTRGQIFAALGNHNRAVEDFDIVLLRQCPRCWDTLRRLTSSLNALTEDAPARQEIEPSNLRVGDVYATTDPSGLFFSVVYRILKVDASEVQLVQTTGLGTFNLTGNLTGEVLAGIWTGPNIRKCPQKHEGTGWWGTFELRFDQSFVEFVGQSIECGHDGPSQPLNAAKQ